MERHISIVINAYNAQAALDRQLANWGDYAPEALARVEFVVVDDGSAEPMRLDAAALPPGARVLLARVDEDIAWNMPGARNLGAMLASGRCLLFHDVDHFLPQGALQRLLGNHGSLAADTLYRFARIEAGVPIDSHINSFLCSRDGFLRAGGYDEDFAGHYGHEDSWFLNSWTSRVGPMVALTNVWLEAQPRYSTPGLNRDTQRNSALFAQKTAELAQQARRQLRFAWSLQVLQG
ncbi:MAG: glycosyltransferase [Burkholderiales bacterium]